MIDQTVEQMKQVLTGGVLNQSSFQKLWLTASFPEGWPVASQFFTAYLNVCGFPARYLFRIRQCKHQGQELTLDFTGIAHTSFPLIHWEVPMKWYRGLFIQSSVQCPKSKSNTMSQFQRRTTAARPRSSVFCWVTEMKVCSLAQTALWSSSTSHHCFEGIAVNL